MSTRASNERILITETFVQENLKKATKFYEGKCKYLLHLKNYHNGIILVICDIIALVSPSHTEYSYWCRSRYLNGCL